MFNPFRCQCGIQDSGFQRLPIWINKPRSRGHVIVLNNHSPFFAARYFVAFATENKCSELFETPTWLQWANLLIFHSRFWQVLFGQCFALDAKWLMAFGSCTGVVRLSSHRSIRGMGFFVSSGICCSAMRINLYYTRCKMKGDRSICTKVCGLRIFEACT